MLEMPKLIKTWKRVRTASHMNYSRRLLLTRRAGREEELDQVAEIGYTTCSCSSGLIYHRRWNVVHTPCISMYHNLKIRLSQASGSLVFHLRVNRTCLAGARPSSSGHVDVTKSLLRRRSTTTPIIDMPGS